MAKHTQLEYGRLLKEQFEKLGMRVGLLMEEGERGWEGSMVLARGDVRGEGSDEYIAELHSDVHVYVDDEGAIRTHYSEPIIVDIQKKARYDAWQEEEKRREAEMQLQPERYFAFDEDDEYLFEDCEAEAYEEMQPAENSKAEAELHASESEESVEDLVHISEKQELELLRALNNEYLKIDLYNRMNENRLIYHGRYRMDACSRSSAKKAAAFLCDELFVMCGCTEYLSKQLGFVRVAPQKKWESWADTDIVGDILDDFSQIAGYLAAKRREKEKAALVREIEEKRSFLEWITDKLNNRPYEEIYERSEDVLKQYRQEIEALQAELDEFEN